MIKTIKFSTNLVYVILQNFLARAICSTIFTRLNTFSYYTTSINMYKYFHTDFNPCCTSLLLVLEVLDGSQTFEPSVDHDGQPSAQGLTFLHAAENWSHTWSDHLLPGAIHKLPSLTYGRSESRSCRLEQRWWWRPTESVWSPDPFRWWARLEEGWEGCPPLPPPCSAYDDCHRYMGKGSFIRTTTVARHTNDQPFNTYNKT